MSFNTSKFKSPSIDLLNRCGLTEKNQTHGVRSEYLSTLKVDATGKNADDTDNKDAQKNLTAAAGGLIVHLNPLMWLTGTISDSGQYDLVLHKKSGVTLEIKLKVYIESKLLWDITSWGSGQTELSANSSITVSEGRLYYIKFLCNDFPNGATLTDGHTSWPGSRSTYCKLMDPDIHTDDGAVVGGGEVVNNEYAYSAYTIPFYTFKAPTLTDSVSNTKLNLNSSETKISSVSCKVSLGSDKIGTYCVGQTNGYIEYHYSVSKGSTVVASGAFSGGKFTGTTSNTSLSANLNLTDAGTYTVKISAEYTDNSMWWYGATPSTTTVKNLGSDSVTVKAADTEPKDFSLTVYVTGKRIYVKGKYTDGTGSLTVSGGYWYVNSNTQNTLKTTDFNYESNDSGYSSKTVNGVITYGNNLTKTAEVKKVSTLSCSITKGTVTANSITVRVTSPSNGHKYDSDDKSVTCWIDGIDSTVTTSTLDTDIQFTKLSSNTSYTVKCCLGDKNSPLTYINPNDATSSIDIKTPANIATMNGLDLVASGTTAKCVVSVGDFKDADSVSGTITWKLKNSASNLGSKEVSFSTSASSSTIVVTGLSQGSTYTFSASNFKCHISGAATGTTENMTNPSSIDVTTFSVAADNASGVGNKYASVNNVYIASGIYNTSTTSLVYSVSPQGTCTSTEASGKYNVSITGLTPLTDYVFRAEINNVYAYGADGKQSTTRDAYCTRSFKTTYVKAKVVFSSIEASGTTIKAALTVTMNDANGVTGTVAIANVQSKSFSATTSGIHYVVLTGLSNGTSYTVSCSDFKNTAAGLSGSESIDGPGSKTVTTYKVTATVPTTKSTYTNVTNLKIKSTTITGYSVTGANAKSTYSLTKGSTVISPSSTADNGSTIIYANKLEKNTSYRFYAEALYSDSSTVCEFNADGTKSTKKDATFAVDFTTGIPAEINSWSYNSTTKSIIATPSITYNNSDYINFNIKYYINGGTTLSAEGDTKQGYGGDEYGSQIIKSGLAEGSIYKVVISASDNDYTTFTSITHYVRTYLLNIKSVSKIIRSADISVKYGAGGAGTTYQEASTNVFSNNYFVIYTLNTWSSYKSTDFALDSVLVDDNNHIINIYKLLKESTAYTATLYIGDMADSKREISFTTATAAKDFDIKVDATGTTADFKVTYTPAKHSNGTLLPNNKIFIEILLSYASREIHPAVDTSNKTYTLEHTADSTSAVTLLHNTSSGLPTSTTYNLTYKVYDSEDCYSTGYGNTYSGSSSDKPEFITYKTSTGYTGANTVVRTYDTRIYSTEYSTRSLITSYQCTNGFNYYTSYNAHVLSAHTDKIRYELYTLEKTDTGDIIGTLVNSGYSTSGVNDGTTGNGAKFKDIMLAHNTPMLFRTYIVRSDNSELKDRNGRIDTARDFYFCTHRLDFYLKKSIFHTHVITQYIQGVYVDKNVEDDDNVVYSDGDCYDYNKDDISNANTYISFVAGNSVIEEKNSIITNIYGASNGDANTREIDNNATPRRITFRDLTDAIRYTTKLSYSDGYNTVSRTYDNMCTLPITALIANKQKDEFEDYIPYICVNGQFKKAIPYVCYRNTNGVLEWKEARCTKEPEGVIKEYDYKYD